MATTSLDHASAPELRLESQDVPLARATAARDQAERRRLYALLAPALTIILGLGIAPLSLIVIYSFLRPGEYFGVEWTFQTDAYLRLLFERDIFDPEVLTFDPSYLEIFGRSLMLSAGATLGCLILGFPTAWFIATRPPHQRNLWLFLVTLPFWTNLLIRTFAVLIIIRDNGIVSESLQAVGVVPDGYRLGFLYTDAAVWMGLVYAYLPFMVLPLYASLEKMDARLIEAANDLYASRWQVLRRIIIPLARPGIIAGSILVLIPGLGAYITPVLLGGGTELMIGNLIEIQFNQSRNWPFGSAISLVLLAMVMVALMVYVTQTTGRAAREAGAAQRRAEAAA